MWEKAKLWISSQTQPYFIWLHYMGTHWEPIESLSLPEEYKKAYSPLGQFFDGKISLADKECIGEIINFLKEKGVWDESVFVILSDHGDDLPGNDPPYIWGGHNQNLFDSVMKIALIARAPGSIKPETRVDIQASSIDLMPTLLDIVGAPIPENIEGKSLLTYCDGNSKITNMPSTNFAYMENIPRHWVGIRTSKWKLILTDQPEPQLEEEKLAPKGTLAVLKVMTRASKQILQDNKSQIHPFLLVPFRIANRGYRKFKNLFSKNKYNVPEQTMARMKPDLTALAKGDLDQTRVFALFDLENDPNEQNDMANKYPEIVNQLKLQLESKIKQIPPTKLVDLNDEEQEKIERQLEALGYL